MRIDEVHFNNFRKYVDTKVQFNKSENDMHVVIADNGAGKTTFLNALTWCLYNEEPKIKNKKEALPTLNTEVIKNSSKDKEIASVSIHASGEGYKFIFKREDIFRIHSIHSKYYKNTGTREEWLDQKFSVTEISGNNHNVCRDKDECDYFVSSFIPKSIKEFFFFDGEQLDNYFLSSSNIKEQVFKLSNIVVLNTMKRRFKEKLSKLRKIWNPNGEADKILNEYNALQTLIESEKKRFEQLEDAYKDKGDRLDHLMKHLGKAPSLEDIEEKRAADINSKNEFETWLHEKKQEVLHLIIKESPNIFIHNAFKKSLNLIDLNKGESDFYLFDESILKDSIQDKSCKLCDRELNDDLIKIIQNKLSKLVLISPTDKILQKNETYFKNAQSHSEKYISKQKKLQNEINFFEKKIEELEKQIDDAYTAIEVNEYQRESINERDELLRILPGKKSELNCVEENITELEKKANKLLKNYERILAAEKEYAKVFAKQNLCKSALKVIKKVEENIMAETREEVEKCTTLNFFNLLRKSNTYGSIEITEDYEVKLYDVDGRLALSSASASEVELLALAFTLAIHSISGFESPLVVDTLLARTNGVQRLNVANACLDISKKKQLLLFLIDDEYTEPVQNLFGEHHISKYVLMESESEKEILIKSV